MTTTEKYKPPFVWFGGKAMVADIVWDALGDPKNYIEPFFGSGAVLLLRPSPPKTETVNDADGLLSNFWRALQRDPDAVAVAADEPVSECDLHARHLWLVGQRESITDRLCGDPDFYDAKAAGWWCWGLNCWIGGGWCSGKGPWIAEDGKMVLGDAGRGVKRTRPHLGNAGQGVNRTRPHLGNAGQGECAARRKYLSDYLRGLADRLRNVRVCCGDWSRVCGPSVTFKHGVTGVFLDPPYADTATRTSDLYAVDCEQVAHRVREWAIEQGVNPLMRIVLAGYSEHEALEGSGWSVHKWETVGGYGLISTDEEGLGRLNKKRERLYFSPHCIKGAPDDLFSLAH